MSGVGGLAQHLALRMRLEMRIHRKVLMPSTREAAIQQNRMGLALLVRY
jgi:hypothetical protein